MAGHSRSGSRPEARGNQHGNIWSETCRSLQGTEFTRHQEKHERSQRDRLERRSCQNIPKRVHEIHLLDIFCSQGDGEVDVSAKHHVVGNGTEMRSVLVGQAELGTEFRDATSS